MHRHTQLVLFQFNIMPNLLIYSFQNWREWESKRYTNTHHCHIIASFMLSLVMSSSLSLSLFLSSLYKQNPNIHLFIIHYIAKHLPPPISCIFTSLHSFPISTLSHVCHFFFSFITHFCYSTTPIFMDPLHPLSHHSLFFFHSSTPNLHSLWRRYSSSLKCFGDISPELFIT